MEEWILTEEEIRLLSAAYGNDEKITQGKLFDYQKTALEQLRAGTRYLADKYSGHTLEILNFSPATKFTNWAQFVIQGEGDLTYTLTVEKNEDTYLCRDNCYGQWLREPYDAYVSDILRACGMESCTYTQFSVLVGMAIGANTTVQEFVEHTPHINRQTRIYIPEPADLEQEAARISVLLKEAGLYGHYFVYAVPEDQYGDIEVMEQNRKNWKSTGFNCYDV